MSRPKGSKNKKTLLKLQVQTQTPAKVEKAKKTKEVKEKFKLNNMQDIHSDMQDKIEQKTHFVQKDDEMNKHAKVGNEADYKAKLSEKQLEKLKTCKKCGTKIITDSYRIDTNVLTAISSQHREHPRYIELCRDCAKKLSVIVDNWLGKDYPTKWDNNEGGY